MTLKKKLVFAFIAWCLVWVSIEGVARLSYCITSGNWYPLAYGFGVKVVSSEPSVAFGWSSTPSSGGEEPYVESVPHQSDEDMRTIACFGGSTTAGKDCSAGASSWPDQLQLKWPHRNIMNFGVKGTNSDYTVEKISSLIADGQGFSEIILANWINEMDVVTIGFGINKDYFHSNYPERIKSINDNKLTQSELLLLRFDRTFRHRMLSYYFLSNNVIRYREKTLKKQTDFELRKTAVDMEMAVKNYTLNLERIWSLCQNHNIKIVIVRPPIYWPSYNQRFKDQSFLNWVKRWDREMIRSAKAFAKSKGLQFLDCQTPYNNIANEALFCDGVHQTFAGHGVMAHWLSNNLSFSE